MKIIIANKYHHIVGGAERYMFGITEQLRSLGHEVIPFAVAYAKNLPSEYSDYFVPPAGGGTESKLSKLEGGVATKLKIAARSIYSLEAKAALERLIDDTKPDLLYCLNIVNHMSPSIIDAAHKKGVPVVMRMSDYYLVCPSYLFLRDGQLCTDCERGFYKALGHKCIYGSMSATFCRVAGMYVHKFTKVYHKAGAFVTPSKFMMEKLIIGGFPKEKIHHIPTFVNLSRWTPRYDNDGYILYYGRLMEEKGIEFLLRSYIASKLPERLVLVGDGPEEYVSQVKSNIGESNLTNVEFAGHKTGEELQEIVRGAKYVIVPSLNYDNAPNVVYESSAAGKAVIASALGGLCEQIIPGETGILVEPGNVEDLAEAMVKLSAEPDLIVRLGQNARQHVETCNNIETHTASLLNLFNSLVG